MCRFRDTLRLNAVANENATEDLKSCFGNISRQNITRMFIGKNLITCIFEEKLKLEMFTVRGQQHSFSTHELLFLRCIDLMTSSNGNIFRVNGPLCGKFTGHCDIQFSYKIVGKLWIPLTKANDASVFSLICAWTNDWESNRDAGDLRCHRAHYGVTVMNLSQLYQQTLVDSCNGCIKVSKNTLFPVENALFPANYMIIQISIK